MTDSHKPYQFAGLALDPIHVGTGGARLGRVDNTIVRDPVTRIPKIPGSSLAGVMRAYTAMAKDKYPVCAGQGQPGGGGHCCRPDCPVCTVFGFATGMGSSGGFAGLAAFSDMQVLLFPVASQQGPQWITSPMALRHFAGGSAKDIAPLSNGNAVYRENKAQALQLGWLYLPVEKDLKWENKIAILQKFIIPKHITNSVGVVSDKLFAHIVNSNLEVRTSVAIDPATGAAEKGALFTYEALPRGTVLAWEVTCRNPAHFKINGNAVKVEKNSENEKDEAGSIDTVKKVVTDAHPYLEHLGIGGMGSRGMGRLRVPPTNESTSLTTAQEEALS
jgi:CRISPR-associated protein Cmr4